jgi:septal ring factor EnvC (AmiA/AmiB activator)
MDNYLKELQQRNKELSDEINKKEEENTKYEEELNRLNEESIELKQKLKEYKEGMYKIKDNLNKMNEDYINKLKEHKIQNEKKTQNLKKELNLLMNLTKFRIINAESYENGNKINGFFINQEKNQIKEAECIINEKNSIERHINFWKNLKEFLEN